ncbi:MAG: hypothetical protein RI964_2658 [Pseudomonadota bacterium]
MAINCAKNYNNSMQRLQAFQYELMPDGETQRQLRRFAGSCRFVYNKALALQQVNHEAGKKFIGYVAMAKHLTAWRNGEETPWLKDTPVHPLQHALKDLDKAYQNFFAKRADFPRFKRKGSGDSFRYPDPKQIKLDQANSRIFLPKLGWIRYRNSRDVLGELRNVTVSGKNGKWYISIQTRREVELPVTQATTAIGIDLGIARFATFSDGSYIAPLNSFKSKEAKLAKYQRRMAHKQKFSNNWKKAKAKVQKIHAQIANARRDGSVRRRLAGTQHEQIISRYNRKPRQERRPKVRLKQSHPRPRLGRIPVATRLQNGLAWRDAVCRATTPHQSNLLLLRSRLQRQPPDSSPFCLRGMRLRKPRRCGRRNQCFRAGTPLVSLWRWRVKCLDEVSYSKF